MSLSDIEFAALRRTISTRGTVRMVVFPATLTAWALVNLVVLISDDLPILSLLPLAVLVGGFEAVHALHVGAERIGRYLQVYYENAHGVPRWETTAMAVGPALPGGGIDPLFSVVFVGVAALNLVTGLLPQPTPLELSTVGVLHAAFVLRVVRARGAAARQRAVELESYRALRMAETERQ